MLTIAIDEQGSFEGGSSKKPTFIGGIVYDDQNEKEDFENEKKRISGYLKTICDDVGIDYPCDMHVKNGNNEKVKKFKIRMQETLAEFVKDGKYNEKQVLDNKPRKGFYRVVAMIKTSVGKELLTGTNKNIFVKDDYAGNRYLNMAEDTIERLLFHNPLDHANSFSLYLATRKAVLSENNKKNEEFIKAGFNKEPTREDNPKTNQLYYSSINMDIYKTAVMREMLDTDKTDIDIQLFNVSSIDYYDRNEKHDMQFYYMADIMCSYLGKDTGVQADLSVIQSIKDRAYRLTGKDNHIYAYDEADVFFDKAWKKTEEGDYYKALSIAYDGTAYDSDAAILYKKMWYPKMEEMMKNEVSASELTMAIRKLMESTRNNNVTQDKLVYIYSVLKRITEDSIDGKTLYELYDAGVTAFCHIGDSDHAEECYIECEKYRGYVYIEEYLATSNKIVVYLCDRFQYQKALDIAEKNISYHQDINTIRNRIYKDGDKSYGYAKALSQLGQAYAFRRDKKSEDSFVEALGIMEKGSADYYITESYLLHRYIDNKDKENYEKLAFEYFGNCRDISKQLEVVIRDGSHRHNARFSMKFALYVYIKALYTFYKDEIPDALLDELSDIKNTIGCIDARGLDQMNGHPWELIYMYLSLIMKDHNHEDSANKYMNDIRKVEKSASIDTTVGKIRYRCYQICRDRLESISDNTNMSDDKVYTYMYC